MKKNVATTFVQYPSADGISKDVTAAEWKSTDFAGLKIQSPQGRNRGVFALLAFFVASASFRGFRARSVPAVILLVTALLILLSRGPLGNLLPGLPEIADWVRNFPSMAARRAILVGIGLGSLTTSLRVIVGIERTWLGGRR